MSKVIFSFKGKETTIQCLKEDKMIDICLKFASKIAININNIYFIYNGIIIINMELKYNEIANRIDKDRNIMNILVYEKENNGIIYPYDGENIIDTNIINKLSNFNDNINNTLRVIKELVKNNIEIKNIIYQLKNIIMIIDNINEEIKKKKEEIKKKNESKKKVNNNNKNNIIEGIIDIGIEDINKEIILYNSNEDIDIYINNEILINKNKYKFDKEGKYNFKLIFKNQITNLKSLF